MTGTASANGPTGSHVEGLPQWLILVAAAALVALFATTLFTLVDNNGESKLETLKRILGEERAVKLVSAGITPGVYTQPTTNPKDAAEVVASYLLFSAQGRVEEAVLAAGNEDMRKDAQGLNILFGFGGYETQQATIQPTVYDAVTDRPLEGPVHGAPGVIVALSVAEYNRGSGMEVLFLVKWNEGDNRWELIGSRLR